MAGFHLPAAVLAVVPRKTAVVPWLRGESDDIVAGGWLDRLRPGGHMLFGQRRESALALGGVLLYEFPTPEPHRRNAPS
ncbi:hypothetical protein [Pleomorphomonas koreensis]|uniref:hypothetical protein n=1 Tax=Pleomorphomonas koreensis TaxID=257440 RepID=UPI0012EB0FEB|nr:hypothetical protein [Pleomorphomonas koreensis]